MSKDNLMDPGQGEFAKLGELNRDGLEESKTPAKNENGLLPDATNDGAKGKGNQAHGQQPADGADGQGDGLPTQNVLVVKGKGSGNGTDGADGIDGDDNQAKIKRKREVKKSGNSAVVHGENDSDADPEVRHCSLTPGPEVELHDSEVRREDRPASPVAVVEATQVPGEVALHP